MIEIENAIDELLGSTGFVILSVGDYYVQFATDDESDEITFEAVSHEFLDTLGNKEQEFKTLGFTLEPGSNFQKTLTIEEGITKLLMKDVTRIFEEIYKVPLINYKIEKELES